ncbi:hypothetical protein A8F94_02565 [Bacillus sp. FJAT-27225]|uniref:DUF421 domain-containing protein n=1 Tax=Bacillus sp. FJAT-27225 TaxID=1743144 RepID=UPI00080C33A4|nr:YetF domain-containing protein [Bacillus sp. FJAT-27225]OCA90777.1 hypothetical protein A8F94_02565 [Bacillus sp. FJAT-27225]
MEASFSSISRTALSFILLLIISYFFGRQINSHRNHFNMAMAITIGSLVANMGFNINLKFVPMIWSFITMVFIYYVAANMSFRVRILEKWLSGSPTVLIKNGHIQSDNLVSAKYTKSTLEQQLREKDIFSITDVKLALLEPSGKLSVQKKDPQKGGDFYVQLPTDYLNGLMVPAEIIIDGQTTFTARPELYSWLEGYLYSLGHNIDNVAYAVVSSQGFVLGVTEKTTKSASASSQ